MLAPFVFDHSTTIRVINDSGVPLFVGKSPGSGRACHVQIRTGGALPIRCC
ncbi:hypothetical protein [Pseudoxanthomonas sp. Root630]|uniref:hypothetical protein n=1 Tax=Pseudoxanthomonas sp. Root630 TaxID=1736574 RepID=UPI000AC7CA21|nr:hypothetical protein [Pseudoxanthomonas sp. Root630]